MNKNLTQRNINRRVAAILISKLDLIIFIPMPSDEIDLALLSDDCFDISSFLKAEREFKIKQNAILEPDLMYYERSANQFKQRMISNKLHNIKPGRIY
ncbi:MAG TPA: hypothetical protein DCL21_04455 [Alphaproteobacteria bacterium]|nr:hypothetical protein [Alphaproteobacteria bacterium]